MTDAADAGRGPRPERVRPPLTQARQGRRTGVALHAISCQLAPAPAQSEQAGPLLHATRRRSGTVGTRQSFAAIPGSASRSYSDHFPFCVIAAAAARTELVHASERQAGYRDSARGTRCSGKPWRRPSARNSGIGAGRAGRSRPMFAWRMRAVERVALVPQALTCSTPSACNGARGELLVVTHAVGGSLGTIALDRERFPPRKSMSVAMRGPYSRP